MPLSYTTILSYDTLPSTSDEAKRLAREGAENGTVVWARQQTQGRGRYGRSWVSPPGNVAFSLILKPEDFYVTNWYQMTFVCALALGDTLRAYLPTTAALAYKWPNDILLDGRKTAGILIEGIYAASEQPAPEQLIIGIGINWQHFPENMPYPATSMAAAGAEEAIEIQNVIEGFLKNFNLKYKIWTLEGFSAIRSAWLERAYGKDRQMLVKLPSGERLGRFYDLDEEGNLWLETAAGERVQLAVGEVFFPEIL